MALSVLFIKEIYYLTGIALRKLKCINKNICIKKNPTFHFQFLRDLFINCFGVTFLLLNLPILFHNISGLKIPRSEAYLIIAALAASSLLGKSPTRTIFFQYVFFCLFQSNCYISFHLNHLSYCKTVRQILSPFFLPCQKS